MRFPNFPTYIQDKLKNTSDHETCVVAVSVKRALYISVYISVFTRWIKFTFGSFFWRENREKKHLLSEKHFHKTVTETSPKRSSLGHKSCKKSPKSIKNQVHFFCYIFFNIIYLALLCSLVFHYFSIYHTTPPQCSERWSVCWGGVQYFPVKFLQSSFVFSLLFC